MHTSTVTTPLLTTPSKERTRIPFFPHLRISGRTAIWSFLLGVGLVCPTILFVTSLPLPSLAGGETARHARFLDYLLHPGGLFLKAVILMPLLEEVFYRGMVLPLLRRYLPTWSAILITSAFFAATHLGSGYDTAMNAFLLAFIFAWLVIRTGSLLTSILCHAAINLTWLFLIGPAFGLTAKIVDPASTVAVVHRFTGFFPPVWFAVSLGLVLAAALMIEQFSRRPANHG